MTPRRAYFLAMLAGAALVAAVVLLRPVGVAPSQGFTFLVSGGAARGVEAGAFYVRPPWTRVVTVPRGGRFTFPPDASYKLFSRDNAEIPALFDVSWTLDDPAAARSFAAAARPGTESTAGGPASFENEVVGGALRAAARPAAAGLDAAAIYASGGQALAGALRGALKLPPGLSIQVTLQSLASSASAEQLQGARAAAATGRRVLFIGFDALDGKLVDDLRSAGKMPNFDRLIRRGARADLRTLTPMLSPLLWTSMATGVGPDRHGVLDFLVTNPATGKPIPVTSRMRRAPAFWNVATAYGRRIDVVGWLATWPAETINGHLTTDRFGFLAYAAESATGEATSDMVSPESYLERARALQLPPGQVGYDTVRRFLDVTREELSASRAPGFQKGNFINNFVLTYSTAESNRRMALDLLNGRPDILAVYFEYLDAMGHLFMPYAPPKQPDIPDADFRRYRGAMQAAYLDADRILGDLVAAAGDSTVIVVASDHGFLSGAARPTGPAAIEGGQAARWHRDPGFFLMAGPGVRSGGEIPGASVLDVAPTILHLAGLPVSGEMEGHALTSGLTEADLRAHPLRTVPRYDLPPDVWAPPLGPAGTASAAGSPGAGPGTPPPAGAEDASRHVNLGLVLQARGEMAEAESEFRKAVALSPDDPNGINNLGNVLQKTGRVDEAIPMFRELIKLHPEFKPAYQNLAICYLLKGQPAEALPWFDKALSMEPSNVLARVNRGHARLRLGQIDQARSDFSEALKLNPREANAHFGLGLVAVRRGDLAQARHEFEATLEIDPNHASARQNLDLLARPK